MYRILNILLFFVSLISGISSCIEPFSLNLGTDTTSKYVVDGQITDQEGYQTISISQTSTIENSKYNPLSNCNVKIIDNHGNVFNLNEFEPGNYRVWIGKEYLVPGNSYQVNIITATGVGIVSDFDQMPECPEVDSVYYIRKDLLTSDPKKPLQGIQFYIDLDGKSTNSHYYRWDITETWEHHASYPKVLYWNMKSIVRTSPPDYSRFYCWTTQNLGTIYTLSTENLIQNRYKMFKLHYVDNQTQRLTYCYSLLIKQYALSATAYNYWDKLRLNSSEQGGLYEIQPIHVSGNLINTTNPEVGVLGYFGASSVRTKRIFVRKVDNLDIYYPECSHGPIERGDLTKSAPAYLLLVDGVMEIMGEDCVECDRKSGSTVKPDYWPY